VSKISLSDISGIGVKRILDYREISERYPYCSCAKVLYLLSLKKLNDSDFNKILSQTAIYVPNRKYLALLIEKIAPVKKKVDRFFSFTPVFDDEEAAVNTYNSHLDKKTASTISNAFFGQQRKPVEVESVVNLLHSKKSTASATNSCIDKFLNNPQEHKPIKVSTGKNYSQIKIDESSIKEDLSFGTEAIAKLYAEQGNSKKAIRIYQNLMKKHPEKILYYCHLIKKL
jgi:hypothetical protein